MGKIKGNRETEIPERDTEYRVRDGLPENLLAEGRPWMRQGRRKPSSYLGRRTLNPDGRTSAKALRREYAVSEDHKVGQCGWKGGAKESMQGNEDREPARAVQGGSAGHGKDLQFLI